MTEPSQSFAATVASLHEQNARTQEQFARTRAVADRLWELWSGDASVLLGAEWELADGRARALLQEELAIIAMLPESEEALETAVEAMDAPDLTARNPRGQEWSEPELFELLKHAADHFGAQKDEFAATLAAREELVAQARAHSGTDTGSYAEEHRLWLLRAKDVVERLTKLRAGVLSALAAYLMASRLNLRMFQVDLFPEPDDDRCDGAASSEAAQPFVSETDGTGAANEEADGFFGQLDSAGLYTLAETLVEASERLLKGLIAAGVAFEELGPLAHQRQQDWAKAYDQASHEAFATADSCLRALSVLARSVRRAGQNWAGAQWGASGGRGAVPRAAKVKEIAELRITSPPSVLGAGVAVSLRSAGRPTIEALAQAAIIWRTLAEAVDTLDKAVVLAGGFDSLEAGALEAAIAKIAARLRDLQDETEGLAQMCVDQRVQRQTRRWPWSGRLSHRS